MICSECGFNRDTRPYGKDGAQICFSCGMDNKERTKAQYRHQMPAGNALLTRQGPIPYIGPLDAPTKATKP